MQEHQSRVIQWQGGMRSKSRTAVVVSRLSLVGAVTRAAHPATVTRAMSFACSQSQSDYGTQILIENYGPCKTRRSEDAASEGMLGSVDHGCQMSIRNTTGTAMTAVLQMSGTVQHAYAGHGTAGRTA